MRQADNHAGWCVQMLTSVAGWQACSDTNDDRKVTEKVCEQLKLVYLSLEFRVYEVVK